VPGVPALRRPAELPALKRVGHKGADLVVPGNTVQSFEAAIRAGVDMIEFDVLRLEDGRVVLAHDFDDAAGREPLTLEEGLDLFAGEAYAGLELDVDLKLPGYEREVATALRERGLAERALVSSTWWQSHRLLGQLAPGLRRGWAVPRASRDYTKLPLLTVPAHATLLVMRALLPERAREVIRTGRCEAVMAHYLLVSRRLVDDVRAAGGQLYVWTVDDAKWIAKLDALGVDGVITNDPRLFVPDARDETGARAW
jgi:glycerophosphoryl diester phosphodiesterase